MAMFRFMGLFALIPVTVLLTISFFVLVVLRKTDNQGLKAFGYVIAALLWLSALLVSSSGLYTLSTGRPLCPMMKMMRPQMCAMQAQMPGMMKDKMSSMRQEEKPCKK